MEQPNDSSTEISEDIVQPILCQVVQDIPSHNQLDGMAEEHEEVSNDTDEKPDEIIQEVPKEVQPEKVISCLC